MTFISSDQFPFGKHKGETIESVVKTDPEYVLWFSDNIICYDIEKSALEAAKSAIDTMFRNYMHNRIRNLQRLYR